MHLKILSAKMVAILSRVDDLIFSWDCSSGLFLIHSPSQVALGLEWHETWPPIGWNHPLGLSGLNIGWDCLSHNVTNGNLHHFQRPLRVPLHNPNGRPATRAVQGDWKGQLPPGTTRKIVGFALHISMVSCQKGPTRHAYTWQIGPFWQDTIDMHH